MYLSLCIIYHLNVAISTAKDAVKQACDSTCNNVVQLSVLLNVVRLFIMQPLS